MNIETCSYRSPYSDSGDRGADMHEHNRAYHPDHAHVWGPSTYAWEQVGVMHIAPGARTERTPRTETVTRCTVCAITPQDDSAGLCGK